MTAKIHVIERFNTKIPELMIHDTTTLSRKASFAMDLASRWGMVAAMPDGEDSAGRQQLRIMTVEELTDRAISITELMFERMTEKEFVSECSDWETIMADYEKGQTKD